MAKQDNSNHRRSNSSARINSMIENTKKNIQEAEISMEFAGKEELEHLQEKNERRRTEIYRKEEEKREKAAEKAWRDSFD
ncbi:hypothetical protein M2M59_07290 [Rummeliibacillus sp. G93]|uniref:hypothetical protein n=1 Tax=Rummeliibacillus TaxID=648802 RepID=UPI00116A10C7|nr:MULTISPECIES: hypothetical protein [Rummeliibacillus]MBB5169427.1 small acid-soluble spore protein (thioredoxin-like protein) [Rummeliibacillus stabekisii]MCM3316304.1 hypothetical protein [Rummeliibacillus stabekisii]UQW98811.1 hypothetical protein M2M59_07290 [Rummeliibacillus sp. G93]GEL03687.1 hypothetical protein RST01_03140 [Rummeliibacillus stabekisii]